MTRAYLAVTIDTECDKGPKWRCRRPMSFVAIHDGVGERLAPLFAHHRAKETYLLSPEVLGDDRCASLFRRLAARADLGTHLHGELAEPDAFLPDVTEVFQRDYPREVERAKLTSLTRAFRDAFDRGPTSFRAGRFGIGPHSLSILEELGYEVESSVTPHVSWASSGAPGLDFRRAPTQPYHPCPTDASRPGSSPLWEVPVTIRRHRAGFFSLAGRALPPRWLRPTRSSAESLIALMREERRACERSAPHRPCVLVAMFHNVEVVAGLSPYADSEGAARAILGRLDRLLAAARADGIDVVGLSDLPEILAS